MSYHWRDGDDGHHITKHRSNKTAHRDPVSRQTSRLTWNEKKRCDQLVQNTVNNTHVARMLVRFSGKEDTETADERTSSIHARSTGRPST